MVHSELIFGFEVHLIDLFIEALNSVRLYTICRMSLNYMLQSTFLQAISEYRLSFLNSSITSRYVLLFRSKMSISHLIFSLFLVTEFQKITILIILIKIKLRLA